MFVFVFQQVNRILHIFYIKCIFCAKLELFVSSSSFNQLCMNMILMLPFFCWFRGFLKATSWIYACKILNILNVIPWHVHPPRHILLHPPRHILLHVQILVKVCDFFWAKGYLMFSLELWQTLGSVIVQAYDGLLKRSENFHTSEEQRILGAHMYVHLDVNI